MPCAGDSIQYRLQVGIDLDGCNIRARGHNLVGRHFIQLQHAFNHLLFLFVHHAFNPVVFEIGQEFFLFFFLLLFGSALGDSCQPPYKAVIQMEDIKERPRQSRRHSQQPVRPGQDFFSGIFRPRMRYRQTEYRKNHHRNNTREKVVDDLRPVFVQPGNHIEQKQHQDHIQDETVQRARQNQFFGIIDQRIVKVFFVGLPEGLLKFGA